FALGPHAMRRSHRRAKRQPIPPKLKPKSHKFSAQQTHRAHQRNAPHQLLSRTPSFPGTAPPAAVQ
ncbi:MAG: hypothetical protein EBU32_02305, partial [Opitutaceae bacterium]|nr:hypothetical protein [Opitutaceae bacterium]